MRIERRCLICSKIFYVVPSKVKIGCGKYCSFKCYGKSRIGREGYWKGKKLSYETRVKLSLIHKKLICNGKNIPPSRKGMRSPTKGQRRFDIIGKKNPNWKGGITELTKKIRHCFEYCQWRSNVFERDDYTCQKCKKRGKKLEAHHIKSFAIILKEYKIKTFEEAINCIELWNIDNGMTFCKECHQKQKSEKK